MNSSIEISVIIVNYNVKDFLQNLLLSLNKALKNISHEIIIVDNNSTDDSVELLKNNFQNVSLIANKENLGFSKANNQGLKISKGKYLLLINPDTIVSEDTFFEMIKFFKNNTNAGLAGCKILNPDGSLQLACRRSFPGPWTSFCKVTGLSSLFPNSKLFAKYNLTYLDENKSYEVDAVSGSFMMFTRQVYEKVSGLDEEYFMYGEDLDFCYRIQKAGYKIFYVHKTKIIHYKGESTKRSTLDETKIFYKAMHLFVKKHFSSTFLVEFILQFAILFRGFISFLGKYKLIIVAIILDVISFDISLYSAEKYYIGYKNWNGFPHENLILIYSIPVIIQFFVSTISGVYQKNKLSIFKNIVSILIGFLILTSLTFFLKQFAYSRAVVLIAYFVFLVLVMLWRIIFRLFSKTGLLNDEIKNRRILIVGTDDFSVKISEKIENSSVKLNTIVGMIGKSFTEIGKNINQHKIIGSIENIKKVIRDERINEVVFSTSNLSYLRIMNIVSDCKNLGVEFKLAGRNLDYIVGKTSVEMLDDVPVIELNYNISQFPHKQIKILFDYFFGIIILFFIYPFIYLIFNRKKQKSEIVKMLLKVPSILSGRISFVGPKIISEKENGFNKGKVGLTGLWYTDSDDKINSDKLDIFYSRNQNIWLDMDIIRRTLLKMRRIKHNG
ncbi:MAG: glycosyl transferase [Ignavibacteriales bacterium CG_4_9_14_3_um_filter_30_11]|nr:MAG: glycosyl transferase [Ignavibacteriales bacterium CG_4_9_14_3_um_filter_30_11]